jgi:TrmH family RNA methyltransferase
MTVTPLPPHTVTSAANPTIKLLKGLHAKKGRAETGLFLAEGARLALEAEALGTYPDTLLVSAAALSRPDVAAFAARAQAAGARLIATSPAVLEAVSKRENAQTVIGAYRQRLVPLERLDPKAANIWVALEGVRDPGNLGTILRTADAAGAGGVILIGQTCDPFSLEAVRASMGSIFAVPLVRADFAALDAWRRNAGLALIGTSLKARDRHDGAGIAQGALILMGNEQSGLPPDMEAACDALVKIPMRGRADSLNLAVSTALMIYDVWRRQGYDGA